MDRNVIGFLDSIEFGKSQTWENMTIVPLMSPDTNGPDYLTLGQAQGDGLLSITDIADDEYPIELSVANESNQPVLLLDSEEVTGGNDSFSFTSSILHKNNSTTKVPVALTGTFEENSGDTKQSIEFLDSGIMMPPTLRAEKMIMVSDSLLKHQRFHANDGPLYALVLSLASRLGLISEGSDIEIDSMMQIYESQSAKLDEYEKAFQSIPEQKGLFTIIDNDVIGFDLFSSGLAYKHHASKLLRSYALKALIPTGEEPFELDATGYAQEFLLEVKRLNQRVYKSIGCGSDIRFSDRKANNGSSRDIGTFEGMALALDGVMIHTSFLSLRDLPDCTSSPSLVSAN